MTPEDYFAAVKACPRVAWVITFPYGGGETVWLGYATRVDGANVEVVPDYILESKHRLRSNAEVSSAGKLSAHRMRLFDLYFGELPSEPQLRNYFIRKHGKPHGLNW